jgi:hypothetical protein
LVTATESRLLAVLDAHGSWVNFMLPLPAQPGDADTAWSGWLTACNADAQQPAGAGHQLRYRVQFAPAAGH